MIDCICNIQLDMDEGCDVNMEMDDGDEYNLNVSGVKSVNGKVGKVVLDAGDFAYDDTKEYSAGSVGAELKELSQKEIDVDSALSDTSTNPVQNKVVKAAMDKKVTEETGKGLSTNDFTNAYKTKLDKIEEEANKTIVDSALSLTSENPVQNKVVTQEMNDKADVIISSASGSIAHFEDGAEANAVSVIAHIEPVQEGTGDPSPDNIRPIHGWTGLDVVRTGKNLWSFAQVYNPTKYSVLLNRVPFELFPGTYTFSAIPNIATDSIVLFGYHEDGTKKEIARLLTSTTKRSWTTTITKKVVSLYFVSNAGGTISDIQLELGSTATDYEPYQGETHPITFPTEAGTVYGGYVDAVNGELVVDMARVDVGTLDFFAVSPVLTTGFAGRTQPNNRLFGTDITEAYCDSYAFWGNGSTSQISSGIQNGQFAYQTTNRNVWFRNDSCNTLEELKTALSGVYLVYKLSEPIHYQLTPQQITTLLGVNNVWNDCNGNTDVEYKADTKLYIEQLTKPTEDDMTANANIASGKFFMVGNRLFLSTSAIASGDTINPGTNCTKLSLADALNNLN